MTAPIDFQSEENRWAAEMACDEANALEDSVGYVVGDCTPGMSYPLYALALRILRTETKPVDPLLKRAREIAAEAYDNEDGDFTQFARTIMDGKLDHSMEVKIALAALKERGV